MNTRPLIKMVLALRSISAPRIACALLLASTIFATCIQQASAANQSSALTAVYGRGVHAYFAGNSTLAEQYFTQVIQAGSTDPRPYYYRAMLRLHTGRQSEAQNDMRVGATYEAQNPGTQHSIGLALQRIQGQGRRTLENFRRKARLDRLQQRNQQTQQRYEQIERRAPTVIRNPVPVPLGQPVQPPIVVSPPAVLIAPTPAPTLPPAAIVPGPQMPSPVFEPAPLPPAPVAVPDAVQPGPFPQPLPPGSGTKTGSGTKDDDVFATPPPVTPLDNSFGPAEGSDTRASEPSEPSPFGDLPSPPTEETEETDATPEESDIFGESDFGDSETSADASDDNPFGDSDDEADGEPEAETEEFGEPMEEAAEADDDNPFGDSADEEDTQGDAQGDTEGDDLFGEPTDSESESSEETPESEKETPAQDSSEPAPESDSQQEDSSDDSTEDDDNPFGDF